MLVTFSLEIYETYLTLVMSGLFEYKKFEMNSVFFFQISKQQDIRDNFKNLGSEILRKRENLHYASVVSLSLFIICLLSFIQTFFSHSGALN